LKIKIFTWQLAINRLPSSEQINHRCGPTDGLCVRCGQVELADHIFFSCAFAAFMWSGVRAMLQVNWNPTSFAQFFRIISELSPGHGRAVWILFAAQSWVLWHICNKIVMEQSFPNQSADCVLKTFVFLQQWRPLLKTKDLAVVEILEELIRKLHQDTRFSLAPGYIPPV
jgi:hypothetical protein